MRAYKIIRHYMNGKPSVVMATGFTKERAQAHCKSPETNSLTARSKRAKAWTAKHGDWFDGYDAE